MNKKPKAISVLILIIIATVIGAKIYVNNEMDKIDWIELDKKLKLKDKRKQDSLKQSKLKIHDSQLVDKNYKSVNKLFFPISNDWKIEAEVHETSIDFFNVILTNKNKNSIVSVASQRPHKYITKLDEMAKYYNEKIVRNLKNSGISLISNKVINQKFQNNNANYEYYTAKFEATGEIDEFITINFIYENYVYTISYLNDSESLSIIESVKLN